MSNLVRASRELFSPTPDEMFDSFDQLYQYCSTLQEHSVDRWEPPQSVTDAFVDKGYRGHDYKGEATIHLAGSSSRNLTRAMKRRRKRRSAVEPKIGYLKCDHRMQRCFLKGLIGDAINATRAAAGSNLLKLLRVGAFADFLAPLCVFSPRFGEKGPSKPSDGAAHLKQNNGTRRRSPLRKLFIA